MCTGTANKLVTASHIPQAEIVSKLQVGLCLMHQLTDNSEAQQYLVYRTVRSRSSVWSFQGPEDTEKQSCTMVTIHAEVPGHCS